MKKFFKLCSLIMITVLCLSACDNSLSKANRIVGLIQASVTTITDNLSQIQNLETSLQSDFETVLAENDLSLFNQEDNQVATNISQRDQALQALNTQDQELSNLIGELETVKQHENLPNEQIQVVIDQIKSLQKDLQIYTADYLKAIQLEQQSFAAIANPESDYTAFFKVLSNVNNLAVTNNINLNQVVKHFEQLNINLVNLKVALINLGAKDE